MTLLTGHAAMLGSFTAAVGIAMTRLGLREGAFASAPNTAASRAERSSRDAFAPAAAPSDARFHVLIDE